MANSKNNSAKNANSSFSPAVIVTICLAVAILAGVIVWSVFAKQANSLDNKVAMEVGETSVSGLEYQFYYKNEIANFQNQYSSYLSVFGVDFTKDLNEQTYLDGSTTWADYFSEIAKSALVENTLLYNEAIANGYELSDAEKEALDSEIDSLGKAVSQLGYGVDYYLEAVYGKGITANKYKELLEKSTIVSKYVNNKVASYEYTDDECENYYNENKNSFDTATLRSYVFNYTVPTDVAEGDESYKDEARNSANAMLEAITDEASFATYLNDNVLTEEEKSSLTEDYSLTENISYKAVSTEIADWIFDDARVEGDKVVIEANNAFNVIYFISCGFEDYNLANIRHIFVEAEEVEHEHDEDGNHVDSEEYDAAVDAAVEAAMNKANDIYNEWKSGDATAESFGALAVTYSADTSSASNNGIITGVTKDTFTIDDVTEWIFDSARAEGDCDIVESEYGAHIIYFESEGDSYKTVIVKNTLASNEYSEYISGLKENAEIVLNEEVIDIITK